MEKFFTLFLNVVIFIVPIIILCAGVGLIIKRRRNNRSIVLSVLLTMILETLSLIPLYCLLFDDGIAIAGISLIILNLFPVAVILGVIALTVAIIKKIV